MSTATAKSLSKIGPYLLEAVLGQGGMGVVYRGVHRETGARVAVKTVRLSEADRLSQIRREVQSLSRLDHPGVVRVFEHGVDAGMPWYAMELLEGRTLADLLAEAFRSSQPADSTPTAATLDSDDTLQTEDTLVEPIETAPLPPASGRTSAVPALVPAGAGRLTELLGMLHRLCETLAYVHGEGVVHRDVKPSNVFITGSGRPVLVDFGLAARLGDAGGRDVVDSDGLNGGSARYMAPEQIRGEPLDPRCDLYALGCVLFELVTGRTPFIGNTHDVIDQHLRRPAPRLSRLAGGVPPELERLVTQLLTKDRRERLGYARDVVTALQPTRPMLPVWDRPPPRDRTYLYRPPLVGRQRWSRDFERLLHRLHEQRGGMVLVRGESGIGKTRFAMEMALHASRLDVQVLASGCTTLVSDAGGEGEGGRVAPLEPLVPFLRAVADRCIEGGESERARLLGPHLPLLAAFEPALAELAQSSHVRGPGQLPAAAARERLYRALSDVLAAYVAGAPLLLILDDLQWADEHTLGLLRHLTSGVLRHLPVLVLGLMRAEELGDALHGLMNTQGVHNFALGRLAHEDVVRMVAGMLSLDNAPPEFARFLSDKSEGNAFFVAEYLRIAVAEQLLVRDQLGQWTLAESSEPTAVLCESLPLPKELREVVERRLSSLSPATREVLLLAATVGRNFDLAILQQASTASESAVLDALTDLVQRSIIEAAPSGDGFRFTHDKLRELPYTKLDEPTRRDHHRRVAGALDARQGEGGLVDQAALGHHWLEAGEPARAVAPLCTAGAHALSVHALDRAITQYRAAESALVALPASEQAARLCDVREHLSDALFLCGALEDARAGFERGLTAAAREPTIQRARLHRKLGKAWEIAHQHERALLAYEAAERALRDVDQTLLQPLAASEWIRIQLNRMWVFYWLARIEDMNAIVRDLEPRLATAAPVERSEFYQALVRRDLREHRYVVSDQTLESAQRSLADAEAANAPIEATFARFTLGVALFARGQLTAAESELLGARAEARRIGDATTENRCLAYLTLVQRSSQRVDETRSYSEETLERATIAKMGDYVGVAQACLGWIAWKRGDLSDALQKSQAALDAWAGLSFTYPFQCYGILTWLAVQLDRVPLRNLVAVTSKLFEPDIARLPSAIEAPLLEAVAAYAAGDREAVQEAFQRGLSAARELGYL
ncbi:MAG: protein kinase [Polyangiales bacterium]